MNAPVNTDDTRLYEEHRKVYPKAVKGTYRKLKWVIMSVLLAIYYITPWIRFDRGPNAPDQAILLDLGTRRFYFFFAEIWAQEVYYFAGAMVVAALGLFLVTSMVGRAWCGYACPQTVWTDLFVHVERWIEGDRSARIRLDKGGWSLDKLRKKIAKHGIWLLISVATGGAWIFYFTDAPTLLGQLLHGTAPLGAIFFIGLFTGTTYLLGGLAREQVCIYMCPWPRIQGALLDSESLLVSYKPERGEPRGPIRKHAAPDAAPQGDCIDCKACVHVCPTGTDIREGPQLSCIQCALCIDACDEIMDMVGRPRGLINYDSFKNTERRAQGLPQKLAFVRTRTIVYMTLIGFVSSVLMWAFLNRTTADLALQPERNPLYVLLSDGGIRNTYTVHVLNKQTSPRTFAISLQGLPGAQMRWNDGRDGLKVEVPADLEETGRLFVTLPAEAAQSAFKDGAATGRLVLTDEFGASVTAELLMRGPKG